MADRIAVLKDGVLQQVDTPQHLYDHPGNVFVAGFIGSPSMNFFDATVVEEADTGKFYIDGGSFRLAVPDSKVEPLRPYKGQQIIFGIRPEDIHAYEFTPPGVVPAELDAEVDVTELMGNEIFIYGLTGGRQFIARVDPRTRAHSGETMRFNVNMENMHAFDPSSENAIL